MFTEMFTSMAMVDVQLLSMHLHRGLAVCLVHAHDSQLTGAVFAKLVERD